MSGIIESSYDELETKIEDRLASYRLGAWRSTLNDTTAPIIGIMGDSMLANAGNQLQTIIRSRLGFSGYAFASFGAANGAVTKEDPTTWFLWNSVVLSASGHTAEIGSGASVGANAADTIKVYYATKPGGGTFKLQTKIDAGAWTDEAGYTAVSTNAAVSSQVITLAKTGWRKQYSVRAVWVSGNVDMIGGGLYLASETGARIAYLSAGGYAGNMPDWVTQNTAILNPIFADIGMDLIIFSHLDGAAEVTGYQATWQNMVNTASGTAPAWMCIGPPASSDSGQHALNGLQAEAMRQLAVSRGDAFWDNRDWAGTSAQAIASGYCSPGDISHYTTLGINQWVVRFVNETALFESQIRRPEEYWPSFGAKMRRFRGSVLTGTPAQNEHQGIFRVCNPDGVIGKCIIIIEDSTGNGTSANDGITISCGQFNIGSLGIVGTDLWRWRGDVGNGATWWCALSSAGSPNGVVGTATEPLRLTTTQSLVMVPKTVATLPTGSPTLVAYQFCVVTDASAFVAGNTVAGGGSVKCMVQYNGTAWKMVMQLY